MGFFDNIGATRQLEAIKLATEIYNAFKRGQRQAEMLRKKYCNCIATSKIELAYFDKTCNRWKLIYLFNDSSQVRTFIAEGDVRISGILPNDLPVFYRNYMMNNSRKPRMCNIYLIAYFLCELDAEVMWWDAYSNEHGYSLGSRILGVKMTADGIF